MNYRLQKLGKKATVVEHFDHLKPYRMETFGEEASGKLNRNEPTEEEPGEISEDEFSGNRQRVKRKPSRFQDFVFY